MSQFPFAGYGIGGAVRNPSFVPTVIAQNGGFSHPLNLTAAMKRLTSIVGVSANGEAVISNLKVSDLRIGSGKLRDAVVNGVEVGLLTSNVAHLTKIGDVHQQLVEWDSGDANYGTANVKYNKVTVLDSTYMDSQGIQYAKVSTTYNARISVEGIGLAGNFEISNTLGTGTIDEIVVIGFTYDAKNTNIFIPNVVVLDDEVDDTETATTYYPVREIWNGTVIAGVSGSQTHALTTQEMMRPEKIDFIPAALHAPFITKISLKRRIQQDNFSIFSGVCPRSVYMPSLRKVVGASVLIRSPIFCSLNGPRTKVTALHFPALEEIKNCVFGSNLKSLMEISLPSLKMIDEVVFLKDCPMLKEISFPSLQIVRGCDFFMANCYNVKNIYFPQNVKFQPHEAETLVMNLAEMGTLASMVRHTLNAFQIEGILTFTRSINNTSSMGYFLHGCTALMNADSEGTLESTNGIYFILPAALGSWTISTEEYGYNTEKLEQFYKRLGLTDTTYTKDESITIDGYEVDAKTRVIVQTAVAASNLVVPIDPRTALFNTTRQSSNNVFNNFHDIKTEATARIMVNPTLHNLPTADYSARDTFMKLCFGANQFAPKE